LLAGVALSAALAGVGWWAVHRRAQPNLLLVTIDTLRADHLGAYGHAGAATPVLDGLARRGVRAENARTPTPLTGPSHASILTGRYPPEHGVRENVNFILGDRHATLAGLLKAKGYRTAAFVGAYPVAAAFGFGQGFDRYDEGLHPNPGIGQGAERPGNEVADAAVSWLSAPGDAPSFTWVHFYDPHAPYAPPSPFRERFADRPYDGEVAFADAQVGRLLDAVRAAGHEDDTVVVVLADHGEGLGEHDEATHGLLLYESTLRVPLLAAGPGVGAGRVLSEPVSTVDVLPTVLDLLGVDAPAGLPGRTLRPALRGERLGPEPLYAEALFGRLNCRWSSLRSWTDGEWKLIEGATPELFHLPSDPGERRDRAGDEPQRVGRMRAALRAAVRAMAPGGDTARPFTLSPEQAERLASLGYTAGSGGSGPLDDPGLPDPRPRVGLYERLQAVQSAVGPAIGPAIREVARILDQDPGNPFAHFVMASLAYRGGELELARQAFARTLALDPDRPVMRQHYGSLLRDMGRLDESERELRIAVAQAAADDYLTQLNLAQTLAAQGKAKEAETIARGVLEKQPRHTKAHEVMGSLLAASGRAREAIPHLERAAEGSSVEASIRLAEAHLAAGDAEAALRTAQRALERARGHPWALGVAGHALVKQGRREEGLTLLHRAVSVGPRRPEVWGRLAEAFTAAGDERTASECRRHASALVRAKT
jgi:arylsulfatase A-like enzyme/Tfp pilus assembly protein PilF